MAMPAGLGPLSLSRCCKGQPPGWAASLQAGRKRPAPQFLLPFHSWAAEAQRSGWSLWEWRQCSLRRSGLNVWYGLACQESVTVYVTAGKRLRQSPTASAQNLGFACHLGKCAHAGEQAD